MSLPPENPSCAAIERYRILFEGNACPMWVVDAETLAFLEVNEAATRLYGYAREQFLKMTLKDIGPKENPPGPTGFARDLSGDICQGNWRHIKRDGGVVGVEM